MKYGIKVIRSDGEIFNFESDFTLIEVTGIDFAPVEIFKEARGFGNGDIITGKRKYSREIGIKALSNNHEEPIYRTNRDLALAFFNTNYTYDLVITYIGRTMASKECVISRCNYPSERFNKNAFLNVEFTSPYADLFADNTDITSFINTIPIWHDTRIYMPNGKLAFGEIKKVTEKVINYLGSEPAPLVVTVKATGYVPGIDIAIDGKKTSIKTTLSSGDMLIVDCEERAVTKNGSPVPVADYDAWELMEMLLKYGDNFVKVSKNSNTAFTAEISYVGRYGGL